MDVFYVSSSFHLVPSCTLRFTEALEVHDLPRTQEFDGITHVRIVGKAQNVVIRHARLLLCCDGVRTTFDIFAAALFNAPARFLPAFVSAFRSFSTVLGGDCSGSVFLNETLADGAAFRTAPASERSSPCRESHHTRWGTAFRCISPKRTRQPMRLYRQS